MARDALEVVMVDGVPTFPNVPRKGDGSVDWTKLTGSPDGAPLPARTRDGRRIAIDPKPSVPHPTTGAPTRPT